MASKLKKINLHEESMSRNTGRKSTSEAYDTLLPSQLISSTTQALRKRIFSTPYSSSRRMNQIMEQLEECNRGLENKSTPLKPLSVPNLPSCLGFKDSQPDFQKVASRSKNAPKNQFSGSFPTAQAMLKKRQFPTPYTSSMCMNPLMEPVDEYGKDSQKAASSLKNVSQTHLKESAPQVDYNSSDHPQEKNSPTPVVALKKRLVSVPHTSTMCMSQVLKPAEESIKGPTKKHTSLKPACVTTLSSTHALNDSHSGSQKAPSTSKKVSQTHLNGSISPPEVDCPFTDYPLEQNASATADTNASSPAGGHPKRKNTRKHTLGLKLINQPSGFKRKAIIKDGRILATDNWEAYPRTQVKVLWRQYAAGPYARWSETPDDKKNDMWNAYKVLFEFNVSDEEAKQVLFDFCAQNYANWMFQLRQKHYAPFQTFNERVKMVPEHMRRDDWTVLVNYWSSAEFQKKSSTNKRNRSKNQLTHSSGTNPFALRRYKNEIEGKSNDPLDLWFQNHTKKDSTFVNKRAEEIYEKVQAKKAIALADGATSYDENHGFREVCGPPKSGKIVGYGRGVRPSMIFSSLKRQAVNEELKQDNEELKQKVKSLTSEVSEMKELLNNAILVFQGMQQQHEDEAPVKGHEESSGEDDFGEHYDQY